ncbi:MAG: hypothetical protein L0H83_00970 [Salinisphaera sp.]|nr:hypothetical protein [Salinisphaera sp.]
MAQVEWVPQPHLGIGVDIQYREFRIEPRCPVVIEQKPDAHAPIGGPLQCIKQQIAGQVGVPDVVLRVD